jgi:uncharacterized membrane protein YedE/YeeE
MTMAMSPSAEPQAATRRFNFSPYGVGAGIGVLSWIAFGIAKDPLGVTTAYSRLASLFAVPILGAEGVAANSYWKAMPVSLDYGVLFLIGLFFGAMVSSLIAGTFKFELVPSVWRERFGGSVIGRFVAAFFGGAIIMYGARLAGGCTSGHGISGGLQLAVSSWLFLCVMFATGLIVSALMFRGK